MKHKLTGKLKDYVYALQQWEAKYPELDVELISLPEPEDTTEFKLIITIEPTAV